MTEADEGQQCSGAFLFSHIYIRKIRLKGRLQDNENELMISNTEALHAASVGRCSFPHCYLYACPNSLLAFGSTVIQHYV